MKHATFSFVVLFGIIPASCLRLDYQQQQQQQQHPCLLQVNQQSNLQSHEANLYFKARPHQEPRPVYEFEGPTGAAASDGELETQDKDPLNSQEMDEYTPALGEAGELPANPATPKGDLDMIGEEGEGEFTPALGTAVNPAASKGNLDMIGKEDENDFNPALGEAGKPQANPDTSHGELRMSGEDPLNSQEEDDFTPALGKTGKLPANLDGICKRDTYEPSLLEQNFSAHANSWTKDWETTCGHLEHFSETWIQESAEGKLNSGKSIFSRLCKKGQAPQLLEPLAGILRDPRTMCDSHVMEMFSIDFLVLADGSRLKRSATKILFDAGGTRFNDAMKFFTSAYEERGIVFDKIYVWEAEAQGEEAYWEDVPEEVQKKWRSRITYRDGVPVVSERHSKNNPVAQIRRLCRPEDFCVFKLDIDTPKVELALVNQILDSPAIAAVLDEFFFEHHVSGPMQEVAWGDEVSGTYATSYNMFKKLRKMGVRAHSWI